MSRGTLSHPLSWLWLICIEVLIIDKWSLDINSVKGFHNAHCHTRSKMIRPFSFIHSLIQSVHSIYQGPKLSKEFSLSLPLSHSLYSCSSSSTLSSSLCKLEEKSLLPLLRFILISWLLLSFYTESTFILLTILTWAFVFHNPSYSIIHPLQSNRCFFANSDFSINTAFIITIPVCHLHWQFPPHGEFLFDFTQPLGMTNLYGHPEKSRAAERSEHRFFFTKFRWLAGLVILYVRLSSNSCHCSTSGRNLTSTRHSTRLNKKSARGSLPLYVLFHPEKSRTWRSICIVVLMIDKIYLNWNSLKFVLNVLQTHASSGKAPVINIIWYILLINSRKVVRDPGDSLKQREFS